MAGGFPENSRIGVLCRQLRKPLRSLAFAAAGDGASCCRRGHSKKPRDSAAERGSLLLFSCIIRRAGADERGAGQRLD
jgi:hypothetical protein